ncbi:endonuclease/exonuclease/phosphatase family protein [Ancylomarina longa]|uniref:Endonuclease/exonuclease/phosphatase family protein n=1 Tax=Ancylomarina longa TaxID=2487017 RepID=A0A434AGT0_9BACT|nr:endonuclease/exonuclease/phosphatase family protein [Ancylomarina longa]RUT73619.1 endonuclease/exonuclease/phosphatase family protein [Ancylomarina longa]
MKRIILLSATLLILIVNVQSQSYQFMTYNLRYDNPKDGINRWDVRKDNLVNLILKYNPDVFGIQEGLYNQVEYMDSLLSEYTYVGVGRHDGKTQGEYSAVFYKKDLFKVIKQSTFWLSRKPDKVSKGWDAALNRICTYMFLEDKDSGKRFWVFNTHFDHVGKKARINSAHLIYKKIKELNTEGYPYIFMGDLNSKPDTKVYHYLDSLLYDTYNYGREGRLGVQGTFNGFKHDQPVIDRIDYIFKSKNDGKVKAFKIIDDKINGRFPSDHLPVMAEIEW